jgi:hypothetical protein
LRWPKIYHRFERFTYYKPPAMPEVADCTFLHRKNGCVFLLGTGLAQMFRKIASRHGFDARK